MKSKVKQQIREILDPDDKSQKTLIAWGRQNRPGIYEIETSPGIFKEIDEAEIERAKGQYEHVLIYVNCSLQFPDER